MGDIADAILDGEFDEVTGEYIGEGVGYPRTLTKNYIHNKSKYRKYSAKLFGVIKFLNNRGLPNWQEIMKEYLKQSDNYKQDLSNEEMAIEIQNDFGKFFNYIKQKHEKTT